MQICKAVSKDFWEEFWQDESVSSPLREFFFDDILNSLPYSKDKTMIELGCVPGDNLVHLYNLLGYKPEGIDYSDKTEFVKKRLERFGITDAGIIKADIFSYEFEKEYDLVFSQGLVEHFKDPTAVLLKHKELAKPGGWIFIAVPNFRYFHYLARFIADRDNLKKHNTLLMSARRLKRYIKQIGIEIIYCGYHGDFKFWLMDRKTDKLSMFRKELVWKAAGTIEKLYRYRFLKGRKTPFFSPWVVLLGRKPFLAGEKKQ
ncbi:MAG: class I SAM-dependent methyltransferase [Candidatus Omnitrophica bacterium]|nr:class I SAM-dependent methyltransferase [Candidatus Omnitrophota bacterium]